MYKLLVVDDETIIRQGIVGVIRQHNPDFEVLQAGNGEEALQQIEQQDIDAMIMDIKMPKMDGITLLQMLKERSYDIITVVLSGYDEFDYAQEAIQLHAAKYLLKPLMPNQVVDLAEELKRMLDEKSAHRKNMMQLRDAFKKEYQRQKSKLFNDLLLPDVQTEEILEQARLLELNLDAPFYQAAVLCIQHYRKNVSKQDKYLTEYSIGNYLEEYCRKSNLGEVFQNSSNRFALLFLLKEQKDDHNLEQLNEMKTEIEFRFRVTLSIGIGSVVSSMEQIRNSYVVAEEIIRFLNIQDQDYIITSADVHDVMAIEEKEPFDMELFITALRSGNDHKILLMIEELFQSAQKGSREWYIQISQVVLQTYQAVYQLGCESDRLGMSELAAIHTVYHSSSLQELQEFIYRLMKKALFLIQEARIDGRNSVIRKIEAIVETEYAKPLSMKYIADKLYLNHIYLGQLYKKERGISLNDYINKVRISKAKKLLKTTNSMVYEIAEQVGFSDSQYFSTVFKKVVGVSPKEYRDM